MPKAQGRTKPQVERIVAAKLRRHLVRHMAAVGRADVLIAELLKAGEGVPVTTKAPVVCAILMGRLSNDLRASAVLASRGYILQSWTVASAALESAYGVGFVGTDEVRAVQWFTHQNLAKHPWSAFDALTALLKPLELSQYQDRFYAYYRQLSAAKHGNPLIQKRYGVTPTKQSTRIQLDPYYSAGTVRAARHGILWGLHAAGLAMWSYTVSYPRTQPLIAPIHRLVARTHELLLQARGVEI